ncbi:hypothetical protein C8Q76DRAFT_722382 [Earliella scabrosa]|nr:hypothetical protein C8Q76DRAFT_722382 [Earliella scabrosa]
MATGARTRKATSSPELDPSNLNNVERLIFAQAVHEFGSNAWQEVSKLLSKHPSISQPKGTFTPQSCFALYKYLMEDAGLEWSETETAPRLERHLRLAQKYYVTRVNELRELIAVEEAKFKKVVAEIDQIRSGAWDDKIRVSMGLVPDPDKQEAEPRPEAPREEPTPIRLEEEEPEAPDGNVAATQAQAIKGDEDEALMDVQGREDDVEPEPPAADNEDREERSDNEAVNELIGHFESDKAAAEAPEEPPAPPDEAPVEVEEDEMQVDEEPVKREEEESPAAQPEPDPDPEPEPEPELEPEEEQSAALEVQVQEDEDVPTPASPDTLPPSRSEAKRKASDTDSSTLEGQRDKKRMREDSEPVDEEDGVPKTRRKERAGDKRFQNMIGMLHSQISQHRYGNIFHNPIKKSEAPDYHDIVKRPMDLKTIKARVKDGLISNSLEFQRDIFLMFANAMMYNRPGSEIYMMAEEMMTSSEREINAFRQTEGFHRM